MAQVSKATKSGQPADKTAGEHMHVKIHAPYKVYFDGAAVSVSAVNETGPFDVLPRHHNFMTLLTPCDVVVRTDRGTEKFSIQRGVMHVKADQAVIFLDV